MFYNQKLQKLLHSIHIRCNKSKLWNYVTFSHEHEGLEQVLEWIGDRIAEIGVECIEWILSEILNLVPAVEDIVVLVGAGERQLYAQVAVDGAAAFAGALVDLDCAVGVVKADKGIAIAGITPELFPVQILQSSLLKFQNLGRKRHKKRDNISQIDQTVSLVIVIRFKVQLSSKVLWASWFELVTREVIDSWLALSGPFVTWDYKTRFKTA